MVYVRASALNPAGHAAKLAAQPRLLTRRDGGRVMSKDRRALVLGSLVLVVAILVIGGVSAGEKLVPKVDNFIILVDNSGSMFLTNQGATPAKAKLANDILLAMNELIPELGYTGAMQTFPPSKTVIGPERYDRNSFRQAIEKLPEKGKIFGNQTPLGRGIMDLKQVMQNMSAGRTAIIVVSDGEENRDIQAIEAAKSTGDKYPSTCFHVISLADSDRGDKTLNEISKVRDCVYAKGGDLSSDSAKLNTFVRDVFYGTGVAAEPLDSDGDGVIDSLDQCPNTPRGVKVDAKGCPLDSDADGVYDYLDQCPNTPRGVRVDARGCPLDSDGDGVYDYLDKCPGTPKSAKVDKRGCWVLEGVRFDTGKSDIRPASYPILDEVAAVLKKNPTLRVEIEGHTDSTGSASFNQTLSEQRAKAVMGYFISHGVSGERLSAKGYGPSRPAASNDTSAGRAMNRRVELKPIP
jgi:OOP family OmpA-OmpF porin